MAILIWLGTWQIQRLDWKRGILTEIETKIAGAPQELPQAPTQEANLYLPVALNGTILPNELFVLVSLKHVGAGYRVIAPFQTDDGRTLLLDRGFIPVDQKNTPRLTGPSQITGNLHWPDDRTSSTPENDVAANIWFARDIQQMAQVLGTESTLVIARSEAPADPGLEPLPVSTQGIPNDHLQYAITWYSLAVVWLIMTATFIWRQRKTKEG